MSFHESLDPMEPVSTVDRSIGTEVGGISPFGDPKAIRLQQLQQRFRDLVQYVMTIREEKQADTPHGAVFAFRGQLLRPADALYPELHEAIAAQGFTLYLQQVEQLDEILIIEGILEGRNIRAPWWFHLGLLVATIMTTLWMAAMLNGYTVESIRQAVADGNRLLLLQIYRQARQFAFPLLFILGVHEMGHYVAARWHGVKVTLPFFIPLPLFGSLGTLGAVIFIKSPFRNRKQLFDVGIAGPLAGLLVAIPIFLYGLEQSSPYSLIPREWLQAFNRVSVPPFLEFIAGFVRTDAQVANLDRSVFYNHPIALAAWFGILLTSLNLLPMGQFDGGHVAFAVFGRRIAWPLAMVTALGCVGVGISSILGSQAWPIWFIWPLFAYFSGLRHPPPHDDITPIGPLRRVLGVVVLLILLPTMLVIAPFYSTLR